jgi:acyl-CoA synthetase (AMP-forming)/AMP-acid ligase II
MLPQFTTGGWLEAVGRHRITHAFLVPTMVARILDDPGIGTADLSSLEVVTYGAAPMPPSVIRRAIEVFPDTVGFAGSYGQTETTSTVAVLDPDDHRIEGTEEEKAVKLKRLSSVGRAVGDVELRVVDAEGKPVPAGTDGEVQLRTGRTMTGYWGAKEKTRVTIDEEGWVHTGDLGYMDDEGYLFLTGRSGDLIIRGGENIAPAEIEQVLYEHPEVLEAACVGVPDEEWGERVVSAVVLKDGSSVSEHDLVEFVRPRLAGFKRPERILIMDDLPHTSTGKLVRRDLVPIVSDAVKS